MPIANCQLLRAGYRPPHVKILRTPRSLNSLSTERPTREAKRVQVLPRGTALSKSKTAVVVGAQWGDEGKGKIVDVLSCYFDVVARYAGGHNAGHTVTIDGKKFILQLVPCGILRRGCRAVIGNGVVLDPFALMKEVGALRQAGVAIDGNLFVSNRAQVILPYHRMIELAAENAPGRVKIGTTSRGIGPAYEDKIARRGLRVRSEERRVGKECRSRESPEQ